MASIAEELQRQAERKRIMELMQGNTRYDTTLPEVPPEMKTVRDIKGYMGISPEQAAASGMEVQPLKPLKGEQSSGRYATPEGATFSPQDVEFTPDGKYRVKSWGNRVSEQWDKAPMVQRRTWDMGTDANIKKTYTEPPLDLTKPADIQRGSATLAGSGIDPSKHGFPNLADAAELPGKIAERGKDKTPFKEAVTMRRAFNAIGVQYDPKRHYNDQLNEAIMALPEDQRGEALQKMNEAMRASDPDTETTTQKDVKYLSKLLGVSEKKAFEIKRETTHKTRDQYMMEVYQNSRRNYQNDKDAKQAALEAGAYYDAIKGTEQPVPQAQPTTQTSQPAPITREQAIAELKRRGKL